MPAISVTIGPAEIENVRVIGLGDETDPAVSVTGGPINVRLRGVECYAGGGILFEAGDGSSIEQCHVEDSKGYGILVSGATGQVAVVGNTMRGTSTDVLVAGLIVDGDGAAARDITVAGNSIEGGVDGVQLLDVANVAMSGNTVKAFRTGIAMSGVDGSTVTGNTVAGFSGLSGFELTQHGIEVAACSDNVIAGNLIDQPGQGTDDTYDGIILSGDSDRNLVQGNRVIPSAAANATRYGVNVSASTCNDNVVDGNFLGDASVYGTGSYNDAGTGTITARDGNGQFTY
jgi:hypothetical protein